MIEKSKVSQSKRAETRVSSARHVFRQQYESSGAVCSAPVLSSPSRQQYGLGAGVRCWGLGWWWPGRPVSTVSSTNLRQRLGRHGAQRSSP